MTRGAGFGIGDRFKETARSKYKSYLFQISLYIFGIDKSPSPDSYKANSLFCPNLTTSTFSNHMKKNTYCFGTGRDAFGSTVVNTGNLGADKANPGP